MYPPATHLHFWLQKGLFPFSEPQNDQGTLTHSTCLSQYSFLYTSSLSIGTTFLLAGATLACVSVMNASREKQSIPSIPHCCSFSTAPKAERLSNCRLQEQETTLACMRLIFRMHWWQLLQTQFIIPEGEYFILTSLPLIYPVCANLSVFHNYPKLSKFTHAVQFHPVGCLKFLFSFYPTFLAFSTAPKYNLSPKTKTRITSTLLLPAIFFSCISNSFHVHSLYAATTVPLVSFSSL